MSRLECSQLTDPKLGAFESLGYATLSRHWLPPTATLCFFIDIFKGRQDMSQKRRPTMCKEQFPQVWVIWFWV